MATVSKNDPVGGSPAEARARYRTDEYRGDSWGLGPAYLQTAVAMVPTPQALDFPTFCQRNSAVCPVPEILDGGPARVRTLG